VFTKPNVAVLATGDELIAPGNNLGPGQLYASNQIEITAWLSRFRLPTDCMAVKDKLSATVAAMQEQMKNTQALITIGGIWNSEKDLVPDALAKLGWRCVFRRVRLGPGKGVALGFLDEKPVFCLPGGPPSCQMAFLQLALPGVMMMQGCFHPIFPLIEAELTQPVSGQVNWTQFLPARFSFSSDSLQVTPIKGKSRLRSMADQQALICIPEGVCRISSGSVIRVQVLDATGLHVQQA
jgi:molybdopterin molybdotransferase